MSEQRIIIVGICGGFGSVLAKRFEETGWIVSGIDVYPVEEVSVSFTSYQYHQIEPAPPGRLSPEINRAVARNDVILLATPIEITFKTVLAYAACMSSTALLVDLASVKTPVIEEMRSINRADIELLSIHPLFSPGAKFEGNNVVAVEVQPGPRSSEFLNLFEGWGCRMTKLTTDEHDYRMAFVQALSHALVLTLGATGKTNSAALGPLTNLTTPFFRQLLLLLERIAGGNVEMYTEIQLANPFTLFFIDEFLRHLTAFRTLVAEKRFAEIADYINVGTPSDLEL